MPWKNCFYSYINNQSADGTSSHLILTTTILLTLALTGLVSTTVHVTPSYLAVLSSIRSAPLLPSNDT
eukprot:5834653-Ditylum_brightwellii.AAC.1